MEETVTMPVTPRAETRYSPSSAVSIQGPSGQFSMVSFPAAVSWKIASRIEGPKRYH
jgi:hypothetical protein